MTLLHHGAVRGSGRRRRNSSWSVASGGHPCPLVLNRCRGRVCSTTALRRHRPFGASTRSGWWCRPGYMGKPGITFPIHRW
jgi:hypothetical protein